MTVSLLPTSLESFILSFEQRFHFPEGSLSAGDGLVDAVGLDSIQLLELQVALDEVSCDVSLDSLDATKTLGELYELARISHQRGVSLAQQPKPHPLATSLSGRYLHLVPLSPSVLPWLYDLNVAPETGFRWRWRGAIPTREVFESVLWQNVHEQLIAIEHDGTPAGHLVCYGADHHNRVAYFGMAFRQDLISTGIPIEGAELFLRYLFKQHDLRKIYMEVPAFNYTAISSGAGRVFEVEGCLKEAEYYAGEYWDKHILAVKPDRFRYSPLEG